MTMDEARLLIIETSGSPGWVALARGPRVYGRRTLDQPVAQPGAQARRHARDLAPAVRDLLQEQSWRPDDITAVLVSRGPGSYTGLRVGIMSAKAFAYASGCLVLGIDTFAAIALQSGGASPVSVIADAQQGKVYDRQFRVAPADLPVAQTPLAIRPLAEWLDSLAEDVRITGPGVRSFRDRLPAERIVAQLVAEELWDPTPESLLHLGLARLARGEKDDFWQLEPLYLRPSSAEEKWQARQRA